MKNLLKTSFLILTLLSIGADSLSDSYFQPTYSPTLGGYKLNQKD